MEIDAQESSNPEPKRRVVLSSVRDIKVHYRLDPEASIFGRLQGIVTKVTPMGGVTFMNLYDGTDFIQLIFNKQHFSDADWQSLRAFKRYARISVMGPVGVSSRQEISLMMSSLPSRMPEFQSEGFIMEGEMGHVGAQILLARLRKRATRFFAKRHFVELEPMFITASWGGSSGLQPLRVNYPGFGVPAYLTPSPNPQLIRALAITGRSRAFCVARCFTTTYRDAATSYESLILTVKEVGGSFDKMLELGIQALKDVLGDVSTMPVEREYLDALWQTIEVKWPPAIATLRVTVPEVQVFVDTDGTDQTFHGGKFQLFRICWPPNAVLAEGSSELLDRNVQMGTLTLHLERMVQLLRADASVRRLKNQPPAAH